MIIQPSSNPVNTGLVAEQKNGAPPVKQDVPVQQPQVQPPHAKEGSQPSSKQLHDAVEQVNKTIQALSKDVHFTVDKETGLYVVKVVNTETKEVIRQIPSEEMVDLAKRLDELKGLIIRQKA
jgi:flagellar protein FlaG